MNEKSILKVFEATGKMITELELQVYLLKDSIERLEEENKSLKQQVVEMKRCSNG